MTHEEAPASTTGWRAPARTTGTEAPASTSGDEAPASTTGWRAPASTTGWRAPASTTGDRAPATTTGAGSVACCVGPSGRARAGTHGTIVLAWWDDAGRARIAVGYPGEGGIEADREYGCDAAGRLVPTEGGTP